MESAPLWRLRPLCTVFRAVNEPEPSAATPPAPQQPTPPAEGGSPSSTPPAGAGPAAEASAAPADRGGAPAEGERGESAGEDAGAGAGEGADAAGDGIGDGTGPAGDGARRKRRRRRRGKGARGSEGGAPPAAGPADRGPRRAHKGPGHGGGEHHALHAIRSLSKLADSLLKVEGVDPLAMPRSVDVQIRVPLGDERALRAAAGAAVQQILQRVREVREHEAALRPGCVYSYFHGSADAEGCRPSEVRQVFDGYHSTGRPVFTDFVTMAIERKDPNIDRLLAGEDVVLTHVSLGRVLRTQQLAEWGQHSPVFKILGQVDAGLFRVLSDAGRCAFSFQLLRGSTLEGRPRLRLHAVGAADLMDLADPSVLHTLSRFQRRLDEESLRLSGKQQNGGVDEEEFVLPLLQELARQLSGRHRRESRRTQHAVERSDEGQRPTTRAYPDAIEAADDRILFDVEKNTVVVLGPKGRVHVFTPQARHVTSVMMQGGAIHNRQQQGRWRPAEPEERGEFRIHLKKVAPGGEGPVALEPEVKPEP